jgi:hypothetical protein
MSELHFVSLLDDDVSLVIGALNSLGVALADHGHQWSVGESAIYEQAIAILERDSSSGDCMVSDLLVSEICPPETPFAELRPESSQASSQSLQSEYSFSPFGSFPLSRLASMPYRCFVWIYSWCLSWAGDGLTFQEANVQTHTQEGRE